MTAAAFGVYTNTILKDAVNSTEGFKNQFDAVASLNVLYPPVIAKSFSPAAVNAGQVSTLTVSIENPNAVTLNGVALTDGLPAGLTIANPPNASTTCSSGAVAAAVAGSSIALTNATLTANGSCTFQVDVDTNVPGDYANSIPIGALVTSEGVSNTAVAAATLNVLQPPTVAKSFSPSTIDVGGASLLTITLGHSNSSALTLDAVFTDALPGVLTVANPNGLAGTCTLGSVTAVPGANTISYASGASIPVGGCTIQVNVTAPQGGSNQNLIPASGLSTNAGVNQAPATATLLVTAGSLGDRVWNDLNGDRVQDASETGLNGVTVFLDTNNNGTLDTGEPSTLTAGDGAYGFTNLAAGSYRVRVLPGTLPAGFIPTYDLDGADTAHVATATLTAGQVLTSVDFGYQEQPDVTITKTNGVTSVNAASTTTYTLTVTNKGPSDADGTVLKDPAATGLVKTGTPTCVASGGAFCPTLNDASLVTNAALEGVGVTVETLPSGGSLTITVTAIVTASSGEVANTATLTLPNGLVDPNPGDNTATDTDSVTPVYGIGDDVWFDSNHDGIQDPAEPGIAGMAVQLFASDGSTQVAATQTDGAGRYRFDGLVAGSYVVQFLPQTGLGYVLSPANQGSGTLAASFDSNPGGAQIKASVVLTSSDVTVDAGFYRPDVSPASIGDLVWYDTDHDGTQDAGEPGLGGVTVRLLDASHGNAVWATTLSDGSGLYEFTGLPAGNFIVDFVAPTGYSHSPQTVDSDANASTGLTAAITLTAGQALTTVDAGLYLTDSTAGSAAASIGNLVWYDSNGNGIQEGGEPGLPGVVVRLYDATGLTLLATTRTSPAGAYGFSGLAAGNYSLAFLKPNDTYVFSTANQGGNTATDSDPDVTTGRVAVSLTASQAQPDIDAGLRVTGKAPISIGDYVWKDLDGGKLPDSGEGLAAAQVVLYDSLGIELARLTTTAANTNYSFTGVPAGGNYRVAVDTSTLAPLTLVQIADPDGTFDHRNDLIAPAASTTAVDFGYLVPNPVLTIVKSALSDSDTQQIRDLTDTATSPNYHTAHFKITVTNAGNLTLNQVTVVDAVASDCDQFIGTGGSLAPGASVTYNCQKDTALGSVANPSADFTNTAVVTGQPVDSGGNPVGSALTVSDTTAVDVIHPAVTIAKTATNSPVTGWQSANFSITRH